MKTRIIYYCIICMFLSGCKPSDKNNIAKMAKEWINKEIVFPTDIQFTIYGREIVEHPFQEYEYKVLCYIDSTGCSSCKLQIAEWMPLIRQFDSIASNKVVFLFFFHPKSPREIKAELIHKKFDYPVCFDKDDKLNKMNRFPALANFQTFLLDKNNHITVIGNPINNFKIRELYINTIKGGKDIKNIPNTEVKIKNRTIDLSTFDWRENQNIKVPITNVGRNKLKIFGIESSCECTTARYDGQIIDEGETLFINITYKAEHPEDFERNILIHCNTKESPIEIILRGTAISKK